MPIELFQFQQTAASAMADRTIEYLADPVAVGRLKSRKTVPFYQALSSITGSGKTAILAEAVNEISATMPVAPIILWLSKGKVVVRQAYANLDQGGRYRHLLGNASVALLADYNPAEVEVAALPMLYFATVGTFNNKDKEGGKLHIFRAEVDTTQSTTWEALKIRATSDGTRRPLIVVYDEAQNLSDQQTDLLLELEPDAFLLASATLKFPARFSAAVTEPLVSDLGPGDLVTSIPSSAVVESGLVKSTLSLLGLNSPMEETVTQMVEHYRATVEEAKAARVPFIPKAIYVCNTNVVADDAQRSDDPKQPFLQREAPPILIWRHLTEKLGISPKDIAVYADLKTHKEHPLPDEFVLFDGGDNDYERFTEGDYKHIIFNSPCRRIGMIPPSTSPTSISRWSHEPRSHKSSGESCDSLVLSTRRHLHSTRPASMSASIETTRSRASLRKFDVASEVQPRTFASSSPRPAKRGRKSIRQRSAYSFRRQRLTTPKPHQLWRVS